jgi:hypothetical protein
VAVTPDTLLPGRHDEIADRDCGGCFMASDSELIRARVEDALKDGVSDEYVLQFLAELRSNLRDAETRTRRTTGRVLLLAVVFELINRHAVAEATLLFVKLQSLDFILVGIPVLIGYLCYEVAGYVADSNDLYWAHAKVTEMRYPKVWLNGLDSLVIPVGDPFGQVLRRVRFGQPSRFVSLLEWARFPLHVVLPYVAAYVFEAYALIQVFLHVGAKSVFVWFSTALAVILLVLALVSLAGESPHKDDQHHFWLPREK